MRKHLKKRRTIVLGLVVLGLAIVTGAAIAYFVATGSGNGNANVGHASNIELSSADVGGLYPGGADVPVTVDIHNPGSGNQFVNQISGTVENQTGPLGTCLGSWYQVDSVAYATEVGPGATTHANTHVRMLESHSNQNACQGLTMVIDWSSN